MKKVLIALFVILAATSIQSSVAWAQGAAKTGPDPSTVRDEGLEKDSLHNLEVARHYFKLKKAYVAAIKRCEEIIAGNPNFAKLDEVLFIAGESSLRLSESKGKQKQSKLTPDQLRDGARDYLTQLAVDHPNSPFNKDAEEDLRALGGPKPPVSKQ